MKKIKITSNKGILFWITGLSGSGKTTIAKLVKKKISLRYGPTLLFSGDDLRKIFHLNKFDKKSRLSNGLKFSKFCKFITDQKINVIFAVVGMFHKVRKQNRKDIKNYIEIYIRSNIDDIISQKKKKIYKKFKKNIVGLDILAQLPRKPDIIIKNDFTKSVKILNQELEKSLKKIIIKK